MSWKQHNHWLYAWIPLFGAFIWFGMLWAMLITWLAEGRPKYPTQTGKVAYISDVGASFLKPLFITGCSITALCFVFALVVERWLRHRGRLVPNMRRRERVLSTCAILGSVIGGAGLILLSIFDTDRHHSAHRIFLLVFIVGVGLSAIFTILEFRWISHDFVEIRKLKAAYITKGVIAGLLIILAIVFAVTLFEAVDVGGVIEWTIAFGFTFYLLTFVWDLRMAKGVRAGELKREHLLAMQEQGQGGEAMRETHAAGGDGMLGRQLGNTANGDHAVGTNGYAP
ncbi:Frag1/DRAM/Sfk1 family-domain-containing protein [Dichomitus squalens]|uniref:Frag1/DRAM/Sfk1 family-domain-containing protein n=1 Tax=Dichomitus squalens TaxID=114155 RepID=A0A4Q9NVZ5_9APHY|nr:Frag1/DRAM/Sfk1 family-domain-containing protein [Dichomitus squalens]TBU43776.1 Frag1/DRAM/Sfk1 family-domain-containing protein [Dichomitus squalens]